jgi:hypothetical protein
VSISTPRTARAILASSLAVLALVACGGTSSQGAAIPKPVATTAASTTYWKPDSGERHLRNIRQLTFGGNNAESYFSRDSKQLIFQRQEQVDAGCDQQYLMNADGSDMRRVSNGEGRTTCGFFYDGDRRILYSSTSQHDKACPAPPDKSQGLRVADRLPRDLHLEAGRLRPQAADG